MKWMRMLAIFGVSVLVASVSVFAAGFGLYEMGAAAVGQAGAFAARADDVTAIYYNPAALTQLEGTHFSLGTIIIAPRGTMKDGYTGQSYYTNRHIFSPVSFYVSHLVTPQLAMGFGYYNRFGLGIDQGDEYPYRYVVTRVNQVAHSFCPVVAYKITNGISVGAGIEYFLTSVTWLQSVDMSPIEAAIYQETGMAIDLQDGHSRLEGDNGSGDWGFNVSFQGRFAKKYRIGLVYRSEMAVNYEGDVKFSQMVPSGYGSMVDAIISSIFQNTTGTVKMNFPQSAQLGAAMDVSDRLQVELDLCWVDWSCYDRLVVDLKGIGKTDTPKDWKATMCYRLGGQYRLADAWVLRSGYLYDENPVPDKTFDTVLPDSDRHSIQIGSGYSYKELTVDFMYMYLYFIKRTVDRPDNPVKGDFESSSQMVALQLSYRW